MSIYLQGVGRKFFYLPAGGGQKFVYLPAGGWPKVSSIYLQGVGRKFVYLPAGSWPKVNLFTWRGLAEIVYLPAGSWPKVCLFACRGLAESLSIYLQGVGRKFVYLPAWGWRKFVYLPAGGWPKILLKELSDAKLLEPKPGNKLINKINFK